MLLTVQRSPGEGNVGNTLASVHPDISRFGRLLHELCTYESVPHVPNEDFVEPRGNAYLDLKIIQSAWWTT